MLYLLLAIVLALLTSACERERVGCEIEGATPKPTIQLSDLLAKTPEPTLHDAPITVEINGRMTEVDKLVNYPLCNDNWSGIVYVNCDAQVAESELDDDENPLFFKGCNLNIEPNTVVYVAAHNDTAYYKGCSCHTGEAPQQ
jgi:hypothetical protein